jgi:hypothetical protein
MTLEERERLMIAKLATMTNKDEIRQRLANADKQKAMKLVAACKDRLAELGAPADKHPLVRDWWRRCIRSEEDHGQSRPGFRHSRARQMYKTREAAGMSDLEICIALNIQSVDRPKPSSAFMQFVELGRLEHSDEQGVLDFADHYPARIVEIARQRLAENGVTK